MRQLTKKVNSGVEAEYNKHHIRKQILDKGVIEEYKKHLPTKFNQNSEHNNDSLTQVLEDKLEKFNEPDDSVANDTRSEIIQDYHRLSNKKIKEKMIERKITKKEALMMEKDRQ